MSKPACPMCEMNDVLEFPEKWECVTCGHEWERAAAAETQAGPRVVKDAHGNVLADGDCVILIKDLKLGGSEVPKGGSKSKPIRLVGGDHENSCKVDNIAVGLKACFVKKREPLPGTASEHHRLCGGSLPSSRSMNSNMVCTVPGGRPISASRSFNR